MVYVTLIRGKFELKLKEDELMEVIGVILVLGVSFKKCIWTKKARISH